MCGHYWHPPIQFGNRPSKPINTVHPSVTSLLHGIPRRMHFVMCHLQSRQLWHWIIKFKSWETWPEGSTCGTNQFCDENRMPMWTRQAHTKLQAQSVTLYSMHECANSQDETLMTLSTEYWVNNVCYCPCHSHTLHFICNTLKYSPVIQSSPVNQQLPHPQHSL